MAGAVPIIESNRKKGFWERAALGFANAAPQATADILNHYKLQKEGKELEEQGMDPLFAKLYVRSGGDFKKATENYEGLVQSQLYGNYLAQQKGQQPQPQRQMQGIETLPEEDQGELFRSIAHNIEQSTGMDLNPEQLDNLWKSLQSQQIQQQQGAPEQQTTPAQTQPQQPGMAPQQEPSAPVRGQPGAAPGMQRRTPPIGILKPFAEQEQKAIERGQKVEDTSRAETKEQRQKIAEVADSSRKMIRGVDEMLKLAKSGKLTKPLLADIAQRIGAPYATSDESQFYEALGFDLFGKLRNTFVGQTRTAELDLMANKTPDLLKTDRGKKLILNWWKRDLQRDIIRQQAAVNIQNQYGFNMDPNQFSQAVDAETDRLAAPEDRKLMKELETELLGYEPVYVIAPDGDRGFVPKSELQQALKEGYKIDENAD